MNEVIVMAGTAKAPDDAAATYQKEQKLGQEIINLWESYQKNSEELGSRLAQLQGILRRRKGRAGSFVSWLEEHHIPSSTAYRLIAEVKSSPTYEGLESSQGAENEGTSQLSRLTGNSHLGNSEARDNGNPWADRPNSSEISVAPGVLDAATTIDTSRPEGRSNVLFSTAVRVYGRLGSSQSLAEWEVASARVRKFLQSSQLTPQGKVAHERRRLAEEDES